MEESLIVTEQHVIRISVTRLGNVLKSGLLLKAYIDVFERRSSPTKL
jgi:hypothetical protein